VSSFSAGYIASLIGVGPLLVINASSVALGLLVYAATPTWWILVLAGFLTGLGSGATHVGLNAHFTAHFGAQAMNWLHACFGLGTTLGPLGMTALFGAGLSWRWAYGATGVWLIVQAVAFYATRARWTGSTEEARRDSARAEDKKGTLETLRLPIMWLSLLVFFAYTGVESTAGQWAYSLFTNARSISAVTAGMWTSIYWGGLPAGRLLLAPFANRVGTASLLRICMVSVALGAGLLWWHPSNLLSFVGLVLMGFAQGPVFPSLVWATRRRVSVGHVDNAVGFQVAVASLGGAGLSSAAGVLARQLTLETVGPSLFAWPAAMAILHEMTLHRAHVSSLNRSPGQA